MQWFLDQTADVELLTLPCEPQPHGLIDWLQRLATVPALQPAQPATSATYGGLPTYTLAPQHRLQPYHVAPNRAEDTAVAMAARPRLRTARELPPHQVPISHPLDLAYFCFGAQPPALTHLPVFREAVVAEVLDIHRQFSDEIVFQLETTAVLALYDRTPRRLWHALSFGLAQQTAQLIAATPPHAQWIIHLCHGDLGPQPLVTPSDLVAPVIFLNAMHRKLTKLGYPMPLAHIPLYTRTTGPSTDAHFYRALPHLRTGISVIAGVADEHNPADSHTALRLTEQALDAPVTAIAAACGHGRRTPEAAAVNTELARALTRAHPGHD
ncbi:hypothetical protein ABZ863_11115 [Saccharomonospora sp. NPDC046836]|uniref:hypothetical protein n=1 Tax=Saccharomonospora sp. NPDC046836 TaxID=3156921 RepID=UPI0033CD3650